MDTRSSTYEYKNKFTLNQRGGSLEINNSTDHEEIKLAQHSGSNFTINNLVNSELATNNKQTRVNYNEFRTVGNSQNVYVAKDRTLRVAENNYELLGGSYTNDEINAHYLWKEAYKSIAKEKNSLFDISRGGYSLPNGVVTPLAGTRANNPDLQYKKNIVDNTFSGFNNYYPVVNQNTNQVSSFQTINNRNTANANERRPSVKDINQAFGSYRGTRANGVLQYGPSLAAATENGAWAPTERTTTVLDEIKKLYKSETDQAVMFPLEEALGNGGDSIVSIKRHKVENIGVIVNDFPSTRIDPQGRSQPTEVGVARGGTWLHHDSIPVVEDVSNDENFPCGNYTLTVGNKYNVLVGSGGMHVKTTGALVLGGATIKIASPRIDISASDGIAIASVGGIDINSPKLQLRSDRQVYVDSALGVLTNIVVGGGVHVEGELYINHITGPVEVQETESTHLFGQTISYAIIGYVDWDGSITGIAGAVYGSGIPDTIWTYPHTHHFKNIPLRLMESNNALRDISVAEGINFAKWPVVAQKQTHQRKWGWPDIGRDNAYQNDPEIEQPPSTPAPSTASNDAGFTPY